MVLQPLKNCILDKEVKNDQLTVLSKKVGLGPSYLLAWTLNTQLFKRYCKNQIYHLISIIFMKEAFLD